MESAGRGSLKTLMKQAPAEKQGPAQIDNLGPAAGDTDVNVPMNSNSWETQRVTTDREETAGPPHTHSGRGSRGKTRPTKKAPGRGAFTPACEGDAPQACPEYSRTGRSGSSSQRIRPARMPLGRVPRTVWGALSGVWSPTEILSQGDHVASGFQGATTETRRNNLSTGP